MKSLLAIIFIVSAFSLRAQTVANPSNVLHPIMKDIHHPNGPTSVDRYHNLVDESPSAPPSQLGAVHAAHQAAKPAEIVAQIDPSLAASGISLIGTVSGLKGRLYITNLSSLTVTPKALFAVCDLKGFKIGDTAKIGPALGPNESEKIEVLATNANAVGLKLMKLSAGSKVK